LAKQWSELAREEKREERFKRWLSPAGVKFGSPAAKKRYQSKATRLMKAIKMEIPDRVPVTIPSSTYFAYHAGINLKTAMYHAEELKKAWLKFLEDFDQDVADGPGISAGMVNEILDYKVYKWPGHGLGDDVTLPQFAEDEYMKADEYDIFIKDQFDFGLRYFLPRAWGAFKPFAGAPPFTGWQGLPMRLLAMCNDPSFQKFFRTVQKAGREHAKWQQTISECRKASREAGFPAWSGGIALAPFDTFADMLRGTRGIVMDMYRQPEKLLEALEMITPYSVKSAVAGSEASDCPMIFIPMHKGDDSFMSLKQFEKFYWPTFRKLLLGIVNEGCVPVMVIDGCYNTRLEIIKDLPRASVVWILEQTDIFKAKKILGDSACIGGNITAAQLLTQTPKAIKEQCRKLIEVCGAGGGYILSLGSSIDRCNPANLQAIIKAAKEYGVY
jgi:uroporphyrinogen-III decarboxylase